VRNDGVVYLYVIRYDVSRNGCIKTREREWRESVSFVLLQLVLAHFSPRWA
jgi:hypothetical protein